MIGVYGGTFDPFHNGHLIMAMEVRERLGLEWLNVVPVARPPHRDAPHVSAEQRLAMVQAGLAGQSGIRVDDRELLRPGISYTVDTLTSFRQQLGSLPLCLILGQDAFIGLPTWNRWQKVLDLAHIVVLKRPSADVEMGQALEAAVHGRLVDDVSALCESSAGKIMNLSLSQLPVSSTKVRERLARGDAVNELLPEAVHDYIRANGLYGISA